MCRAIFVVNAVWVPTETMLSNWSQKNHGCYGRYGFYTFWWKIFLLFLSKWSHWSLIICCCSGNFHKVKYWCLRSICCCVIEIFVVLIYWAAYHVYICYSMHAGMCTHDMNTDDTAGNLRKHLGARLWYHMYIKWYPFWAMHYSMNQMYAFMSKALLTKRHLICYPWNSYIDSLCMSYNYLLSITRFIATSVWSISIISLQMFVVWLHLA